MTPTTQTTEDLLHTKDFFRGIDRSVSMNFNAALEHELKHTHREGLLAMLCGLPVLLKKVEAELLMRDMEGQG